MFAGGEFYYDDFWVLDKPGIQTDGMLFLNGGRACLTIICDYLLDHGVEKILLPSYLCPSIVQTLERCGMVWDFYQVNEDLSINLEDLAHKAQGYKAIYIINYFGFNHTPAAVDLIQTLQQNGIFVVEDNAQAALSNHPTGDFVFNSIRKFVPYDGGYLITTRDVTPYLEKYRGRPNQRLPLIRRYREQLYRYLFQEEGTHSALEALFQSAEQYYESDIIVHGDPQEQHQIERLDWEGIKKARRENYLYLAGLIASIPEVKPIFPALQADNMPLGLPVYFSGVSRDQVYEELGNVGIGLSIHWEDIPTDPRTNQNRLAVDMANRMLTLVIDQRTTRKQMDYLALKLAGAVAVAKSG